jgi:hypothetical protein
MTNGMLPRSDQRRSDVAIRKIQALSLALSYFVAERIAGVNSFFERPTI